MTTLRASHLGMPIGDTSGKGPVVPWQPWASVGAAAIALHLGWELLQSPL